MRVKVSDRRAARALVRFPRGRNYLAVEESPGVVDVMPINSVSQRTDRARTLGDLDAWMTENPGLEARPLDA